VNKFVLAGTLTQRVAVLRAVATVAPNVTTAKRAARGAAVRVGAFEIDKVALTDAAAVSVSVALGWRSEEHAE